MKLLPLEYVVRAATVLPDGQFIIANDDRLYGSKDLGESFFSLYRFPGTGATRACRIYNDCDGIIFYTSRRTNKLFRSDDSGHSFEVVIDNMRGLFRGFDRTASGTYYCGLYSEHGPASLLSSADGIDWSVAQEWDARHIHDVRINPHNGWIYVVVGEGDPKPTADSHCVFRSTDHGKTFSKFLGTKGRRPLFAPINFKKDIVILGTDHHEGGNSVQTVVDTGEPEIHQTRSVLALPDDVSHTRVKPFFHFLEWVGGTLFAGARGYNTAMLLKSDDLSNWEVVHLTCAEESTAWAYVAASRGGKDLMVVSGMPGLLIQEADDAQSPGLPVLPANGNGATGNSR